MYVDQATLRKALTQLYGTANHLLKIWFVLKQMGFAQNSPSVQIDTSNSTDALKRLFDCGADDGIFYVPFADTPRFLSMKKDASRSIIQTNIQRWASSGSVVTCDPTAFLKIEPNDEGQLSVKPTREYPLGLGYGESGFALDAASRVSLPITAFGIWYGRTRKIPAGVTPTTHLISSMLSDLNISNTERELIFVDDTIELKFRKTPLSKDEIFEVCQEFLNGNEKRTVEIFSERFDEYTKRVQGMITGLSLPAWLRTSPEDDFQNLIDEGAKSILLFGPPRTGKTRLIDNLKSRNDPDRETIQIHEGWGYDNLVQGFKPNQEGNWVWQDGPLIAAIKAGKKLIVLEEVNRTQISQSLGEIFSLIEDAYRGEKFAITLRNGDQFFIPEDTVFIMTMNTIDKSTEDVDDALMGRMSALEVPPRVEDLSAMLAQNEVPEPFRKKIIDLFVSILDIYPMGHGYFAKLRSNIDDKTVINYYKTKIRPVLFNFLGELKIQELEKIDNVVDDLFYKS